MSLQLINRSPDLTRLRDEGYDIEVRDGYLLVRHVPYVTEAREIAYGVLVSSLILSGDMTFAASDHVAYFQGSAPCDKDGKLLNKIINNSEKRQLTPGLDVDHMFSSKPAGGYPDYYTKITTYIGILASQAWALDPTVTATTFPVVEATAEESVFRYVDNASSRAGISAITARLALVKVAIVGLGGTGSYILDLVAKTPVREIHIFDGDTFLQHNAFRTPGAAAVEDLQARVPKIDYLQSQYSRMHRYIIPHPYHIDAGNVAELTGMDFVFVSLDKGAARKLVVEHLQAGIPFVDVGMGIYEVDGSLAGQARVTTSSREKNEHVNGKQRLSYTDNDDGDEYAQNIQIADLNALNAALAVIKWKKHFGFYLDLEREHFSVYQINGNHLINEDRP